MKKNNLFLILILYVIYSNVQCQNGTLDSTFNSNGIVRTSFSPGLCEAKAICYSTNGKIIAGGFARIGTTNDFAISKYNLDGSLDNTFSSDGKVTTNFGANFSVVNSIVEQTDGKIIVAGYTNNGTNQDFAIVRYNSNGTLDNSFSTDGIVITDFGLGYSEIIYSVQLQNDGKIVVGGTAMNSTAIQSYFAIARYNTDGSLDNTFSSDGLVIESIGSLNSDAAYSMCIQNDGKIVLAGSSNVTGGFVFSVARFNSNGTLDNTFSSDGKLLIPIGIRNASYSIKSTNDNKLIVGGFCLNSNNDFCIVKINNDGSLDNNFGPTLDGKLIIDLYGRSDIINCMEIQNDNKVLLAGASYDLSNDISLVRINSNGSIDSTFNNDGIIINQTSLGADLVNAICLQSDGKILLAGYSNNDTVNKFILLRYFSGLSININNIESNNECLIYPNPIDKNNNFNFKINYDGLLSVNLYDMNGKYIESLKKEEYYLNTENESNLKINTNVESGNYILRFITDKGNINVKILIK